MLIDKNKKVALIVAAFASFLTPFMSSSINIALPSIGEEFLIDAILLGWITTSFILPAVIFLVPFGKISDIYGRKLIFIYGILIFTFFSFLCAISTSVLPLLLFRFFQGVGSAMIFSTGVAILTSVFSPGERGWALGINITIVYLGLSLGPVLGGVLTQNFGWRSIFIFIVPFGLLSFYLVFCQLKGEWIEADGENLDVIGLLIYCISLLLIVYGLTLIPELFGICLFFAGILGILFFIRWEMRVETPVLNMKLFINNRVFAFSNLAALINYSATFAIGFLLSLYLQYIKDLSPQTAGLILMSQPIVMVFFSPLAGKLSDRIQPRVLSSAGMAVLAVGLVPLIFLNAQTSMFFVVFSLLVIGFGFALFVSPNTNAVMNSVEKKYFGVASAILSTMRKMGQLFSMGIVMLIFNIVMGKTSTIPQSPHLFLFSIKITFLLFTIFCICGIFTSLARGNVGRYG